MLPLSPPQSLLDEIETQKFVLQYLRSNKHAMLFENAPAVVLSGWRFVRVCLTTGITLRTQAQQTLVAQLFFSVLMLGFSGCNTKDELRQQGLQLKQEAKLAKEVAKATTELDAFEGVEPEEVTSLIGLRHALGGPDVLGRRPRDVSGDVVLLRLQRSSQESTAGEIETAAAFKELMARRKKLGADATRKSIFQHDGMASAL